MPNGAPGALPIVRMGYGAGRAPKRRPIGKAHPQRRALATARACADDSYRILAGKVSKSRRQTMDKGRMIARWEAHIGSELVDRDFDATMNTMTPTPYVNHVPTMTGGVGA